MIRKAQDHTGYAGTCQTGIDVQRTAISGDAPAWMTGVRTVPGPFGTRKFPVRRCPEVRIEGKQLQVRAKTYTQGCSLDAIEHVCDGPQPPPPAPPDPALARAEDLRLGRGPTNVSSPRRCHLESGGCQRAWELNPTSRHLTQSGFDPGLRPHARPRTPLVTNGARHRRAAC